MEIENQDGNCGGSGSHWERRVISSYEDVMSPNTDGMSGLVISPMTLALFEDSGWYSVDYSQAAAYAQGALAYRWQQTKRQLLLPLVAPVVPHHDGLCILLSWCTQALTSATSR
jgi:hypothetical protein